MGAPEAYIQFTPGLITDDGEVTDKSTEQFLRDSSKRSASSSPLSSRYCHARADTRNKGFAAQLFEHAKDGADRPFGCSALIRVVL
jgi:hypothetical protein